MFKLAHLWVSKCSRLCLFVCQARFPLTEPAQEQDHQCCCCGCPAFCTHRLQLCCRAAANANDDYRTFLQTFSVWDTKNSKASFGIKKICCLMFKRCHSFKYIWGHSWSKNLWLSLTTRREGRAGQKRFLDWSSKSLVPGLSSDVFSEVDCSVPSQPMPHLVRKGIILNIFMVL